MSHDLDPPRPLPDPCRSPRPACLTWRLQEWVDALPPPLASVWAERLFDRPTPAAAVETVLGEALQQAYRETDFIVSGPDGFVLRIGEPAPALAAWALRRGAAFLTAWNPMGQELPASENQRRQQQLRRQLRQGELQMREGVGRHPRGDWEEPSLLAWELDLEEASSFGRAWEQNAIVWIGPDAIPQLILLR